MKLRRIERGRTIAAGLAILLGAAVAQAVIPPPDRTLNAIAGVNRASGRTQALRLELKMRIGNEPPIATGELISHPSGLARMEIRGFDGRVDRYLLSGDELSGTMNGRHLMRPRPLLPPYFLLQPNSGSTLRTALEAFSIRTQSIGLAPCGDLDCFVIGDPRLEAPPPPPAEGADGLGDRNQLGDLGLDTQPNDLRFRSPRIDPGSELILDERLPRLWVDTQDLQVQRIDAMDGVVVIFGPIVSFERLKVPAWFEIRDPQEPFPMRFEVERAVSVNAPPGAFDRDWLSSTNPDDPS